MKYYIYKLIDPITNEVRYIGKTNNLAKRFSQHINDKSKSHKASWIKSLINRGILPKIECLEEFNSEKDCYLKEPYYINFYSNLTNHQIGGIGGCSKSLKGNNNPNSKLNEEQVLLIKDMLLHTGKSIKNIAMLFNVPISTIHGITSGNAWSYLTNFTGKEVWTRQESIDKRRDNLKTKGVYDRLSKKVYQYNTDLKLISQYKSISEASRKTNTNRSSISQCIKGELKTANNFIWKKEKLK